MNRVLWCISVFFIGSLLFAAPIKDVTPDPIFKNDSISAYGYQKAYILPELNPAILKISKEVSEMLLADPGGVSLGLQLWLKADAGVSSDINTDSGVWSDQSGQNNHANNSGTNLSSNGSGTPSITYNTTSNLINYNPNLAFNFEQLKVGLDINPLAIGDMDIYVVVDGNNAILGNENGGVDRSIAPNRVSNGVDIQDYFFGSGDSRYNDQLKIIHYSFGATSNASATSFINVNNKLIKTFTEQNSNGGYTDLYIGNAGSVGSFSGQIAEIIIYDQNLTGVNKSKVDSYLSLKYGISLDNAITTDYISSNGTLVFDASANSGYTTGIFGLGRDDDSSLNQKISNNGGSDLLVALQNNFSLVNNSGSRTVNHTNNNQHLIISNNGLANTSDSDDVNTDTFESRFRRVWKVNLAGGFDQDVALRFDAFGSSVPANQRHLLTDDDGDFSNGGTVDEGVLATNKTISGIRLTNARPYFTIAKISSLSDPGLSGFDNTTKVYTDVDFTYDTPTTSSTGTITYSSEDNSIASINSSTGVVSIKGVGATIITASQEVTDTYKSGTITATLTVSKAGLTITANNESKTYDGNAFLGTYSITSSGFRSGEDISNLGGSLSFSGAAITATSAGAHIITPGGYSSNNYSFNYVNGSLLINKKSLIISGITASEKQYDGNTTATINILNADYAGLETGDDVGLLISTGVFDTKDVGTGKTVTLTNTYGGTDLGNYTIVDQTSTTASILANDNVLDFDGANDYLLLPQAISSNLSSSLFTIEGFVKLTSYNSSNRQVFFVARNSAANDRCVFYIESGTPTIKVFLSQGGSSNFIGESDEISINKWYHYALVKDGSESFKFYINGALVESGTTVGVNTISVNQAPIMGSDYYPGPSSRSNYFSGQLDEFRIWNEARSLTDIQNNINNKLTGSESNLFLYYPFDQGIPGGDNSSITSVLDNAGSENATLNNFTKNGASSNFVANDRSALKATPSFTISGTTKIYGDPDFTLSVSSTSTGTITYTSSDSSVATINSSTGSITITGVGTTSITAAQTETDSYESATAIASLTVQAKALSLTLTGTVSKVYDGDVLATLQAENYVLSGFITGESATVNNFIGDYDTASVGVNKIVYVDLLAADFTTAIGTDIGNYTFPSTVSNTIGIISKKSLEIKGVVVLDKVYDGTTDATLSLSGINYDGLVNSDNLGYTTTAAFSDKHVGDNKSVSLTETATGPDVGNYSITFQVTTTASITAKTMTVTGFVATDKAYDATRTATVTFSSLTYDGLVFGDTVSAASAGGLFDTKEVGTNKRVDITATYAGSDTNNYNIQTQPSTTASITGKVAYLTGASGVNKVYDDNNSLPSGVSGYGLLTGVVAGDNVTVNGIAAYDSKNAGSRTIVQGGVTLIGTDAINYSLNWTNGSGAISTRTLTVTARDDAKFVTQTDVVGFKGAAVVGFISDDNIAADLTGTLSIARTNAGTETAGTYTNVLSPSGYSAVNYTISYVPGDFTIVAADELLVTVSNTTMVYGNTPNYTILSGKYYSSTSSTVVTLALPTYSDGTYTFNDGVGGTARFGLSLSPDTKSTANFYKVGAYSVAAIDIVETSVNFSDRITVVGALEVTPKSVTASPSTVVKNYDGTTTMTGMSLSLSGTLSGDLVSSLGSGYFSNAQSGIGKTYFLSGLSLSGTDASNYVLTNAGTYSDTSGIINKIPLQIKANDATKVYDGNPYSGGNGVVYSGFISGEGIAQLSGALSYSGSSQGAIAAGTYVIQPGGFTADNYTLSYVNGSLEIAAGDTDGDGILDINDNCPTVANVDQADLDADGLGDVCDADIDGDGFTNTVEVSCGTDPSDATSKPEDTDGDGIADCVDPDIDNDTILNVNDNCVYTPNTDQADLDGDRVGDACDADMDGDGFTNTIEEDCGTDPRDFFDTPIDTDGDGLANCEDLDDDNDGQTDTDEEACGSDPLNASSLSPDYDSDGIPNCVDPDSDNDGCLNEVDAFPLDETECQDTDGDGTGNNADTDDDNDGQTDIHENNCGSDALNAASMSPDYDTDGLPDCIDPDDDNDSQTDLDEEACGSDPVDEKSLSPDFDSDGIPDCLDPDDDNDGCLDIEDAFPFDASECLDTDLDSIGNNKDPDDDNDGQLDTHEEDCGSDAIDYYSVSLDYDSDGIPDCIDPDIDGDGCLNYEDAFPYNPLECVDTDGDGLGDNEDLDDNNDGCEDTDLCISELITPNESGIESVWLIQNITQYPNAYVRVFDRHRQLVFEQQGYKSDWDGKYQKSKKPLPAGPYYYIVQLNDGSAARTGWLYITY